MKIFAQVQYFIMSNGKRIKRFVQRLIKTVFESCWHEWKRQRYVRIHRKYSVKMIESTLVGIIYLHGFSRNVSLGKMSRLFVELKICKRFRFVVDHVFRWIFICVRLFCSAIEIVAARCACTAANTNQNL